MHNSVAFARFNDVAFTQLLRQWCPSYVSVYAWCGITRLMPGFQRYVCVVFICSNRIEFYFFPFPFSQGNGNGATGRQCWHDYVNGLRKRIRKVTRMNRNVMLETRQKST